MQVHDQVAIVTGASSGIGLATAKLLAANQAKVVLAARNQTKLSQLENQLAGSLAVVTDMRRPADVRRLVERTVEHFGRVDILINNAGQGLHVPIESVELADLESIMTLNVYGPLLAMQAVIPHMRRQGGGSIVNISSGTSKFIVPGTGPYAATKSALNTLSLVAREELAEDGIVVTVVYPYITNTNFHHNLLKGAVKSRWMNGDSPELVAQNILHGIETGAAEVVIRPH